MRVERYGGSRMRDGGTSNEDAFWISRQDGRIAALCDGAGHAQLCGGRTARMFGELVQSGTLEIDLGSGEAEPRAIHERLAARDVVLLMSDGAWTPLQPPAIQRAVMTLTTRHLSDVPPALLDLAGARGRIDDMTVVAMRVLAT